MSLDQALFAWVKGEVSGLSTTRGATPPVFRRNAPEYAQSEPPRIVYLPINETVERAGDARIFRCTLAVRIDSSATHAFGDGNTPEAEGELHDLVDQVDLVLDDVAPVIAGLECKKLVKRTENDGDGTTEEAARTLRYDFVGTMGFTGVPLDGMEGSLEIDGYPGKFTAWRVRRRRPVESDGTAQDAASPRYDLGDPTAQGQARLVLERTGVPLPDLGTCNATFKAYDLLTWTEAIKVDAQDWPFEIGSPEANTLDISFMIDDPDSPFLTGVIP